MSEAITKSQLNLLANSRSWMGYAALTRASVAMWVFRSFLVGCQATTIYITWALWQIHTRPPMLPALPLPAFDMGNLLLLSLALVLFKPWWGVILHTLLLIYAMLIDQTRLQPEIISLALLLWGTLPNWDMRAIGRAHLIALWVWAGTNKLLSPVFMERTGPGLIKTFVESSGLATHLPELADWLHLHGGYIIGLSELSIGLLAIFPRTRKLAIIIACGLHTSIFYTLSPAGRNWNEAVYPWNIGLALAGLGFLLFWHESPIRALKKCHRLTRVVILFMLISPIGFYLGVMDAYPAHNLYSSNVPRMATNTGVPTTHTWLAFKVPLPPEHRIFEQYFQSTCHRGDYAVIWDTRWWFKKKGLDVRRIECESMEPRTYRNPQFSLKRFAH